MNKHERIHARKLEILEFCKKNDRLPSQSIESEKSMYNFVQNHKKQDIVFKRKLEPWSGKNKKRRGRGKDPDIDRLGMQLAESGGAGF